MPAFKIDIISDTVCPWCYIGHNRLQRAISLFRKTHPSGSSATFNITWQPFYLDPTSPAVGIPLKERMIARFGSAEKVEAMQARLAGFGKQEGIEFGFDSKIGRTRDSHRLIELAGKRGSDVQNKVVLGLFKGYFEGGADVTDTRWLESVGREQGLDDEVLKRWKEEDGGGEAVDREAEKNRRFTSGVPQFTVNGKYVIEGAQDPEEFLRVFSEISEGE